MENKLTDNDIIKALECCCVSECDECPYDEQTACIEIMKEGTLDLINRQKANLDDKEETIQYADKEIKRLNAEIKELTEKISVRDKLLDIAEIRLNSTEKSCQYYRSLYNEKVCLCEEQKAEIERLKAEIRNTDNILNLLDRPLVEVKDEAIKATILEIDNRLSHYGKCDELHKYEVSDVLVEVEEAMVGEKDV